MYDVTDTNTGICFFKIRCKWENKSVRRSPYWKPQGNRMRNLEIHCREEENL